MIILLDDTSTSFCHYDAPKTERRLISLDDLCAGIRFAMVENLTIQFVYPDYDLPAAYKEAVNTIDHSDIVPSGRQGDVIVLDGWETAPQPAGVVAVIRTTLAELLQHGDTVSQWLETLTRLNIVITDIDQFTEADQEGYKEFLSQVGSAVERLYVNGRSPQLNTLTDRMMLTEMNNCGAGDTCITLAPNGKFYVCPAFYYENEADNVGDLQAGLNIRNKQLYRLDHAPICRNCDAWQCRRCVWLNRKTTLEVNTPGHQQCVVAHLERNASRELLQRIREQGTFLPDKPDIPEIDYLDPFENKNEWQ